MKIALVHDYIKEYGGAERVLETFHKMYPDAPIYTLVYCPEFLGPHRERFKDWDIRPSFLQNIPFEEKLVSPFRLLAPFVFPLVDFSAYDVVIVSATGAYSPNSINKKQAKQLCYYHTPPRYLYGLSTARELKNPFLQLLGKAAFSWLRKVDVASSKNVDVAIANSENVAERIKKFYRKGSVVIYPPVTTSKVSSKKENTPNTKYKIPNTGYFLAGGRLARPKHIDLIIRAAIELKIPLKIFGKEFAGYGEELKRISNIKYPISNIQYLGEISDEEKTKLMRGAKAYIFAAEDEDFGMLPVEAMSGGTPVIAYKSGGPKESIIDGKTGVLFDELTVESLINAIKKFEKLKLKPEDCMRQAANFSKEKFVSRISYLVSSIK